MLTVSLQLRATARNKSTLCCTKKCPHYLQDEKNHYRDLNRENEWSDLCASKLTLAALGSHSDEEEHQLLVLIQNRDGKGRKEQNRKCERYGFGLPN